MRIQGAVVVITGGSSGIGRATATAFAAKGASVVVAARRQDALDEVVRECEAAGARSLGVATDVTDAKAVDELAGRAVEHFGRIGIWVNNAVVTLFSPFVETPLDDFRQVIDVGIMGNVHGAKAALTQMKEQGNGVIVNVSSIVGVIPQPYTHAYSMAKAAIRALSGSLRQELILDRKRSSGIKVVSVLPATIDTPLFGHAANYTGREIKAMPPVYSPERVARTIVNVVRFPRREVVVGPMGRNLLIQAKVMPGITEKMMAVQVDKTHLSRIKPAAATHGNLFDPASGTGSAHGGWSGKRRTGMRRLVAAASLGGLIVAARRRHQ